MPITLKITSYQRLTPEQAESMSFGQGRFTVGRGAENNWTLPDPQRFLSGTHFILEDQSGDWFLTDTSTNGVFINGSDSRMEKGETTRIEHGDTIRIGDYELEVVIGPAEHATDMEQTAQGADIPALGEDHGGAVADTGPVEGSILDENLSIDDLYELDDDDEDVSRQPSLESAEDRGPPPRQSFTPPAAAAAPAPADDLKAKTPGGYELDLDSIPDNWDDDTGIVRSPLADDSPPVAETPPAPPAEESAPPETPPVETAGIPEAKDSFRAPDAPPPRVEDIPEPPAVQASAPVVKEPPIPAAEPIPKAAPAAAGSAAAPPGGAMAAFAKGAGIDPAKLGIRDEAEFFHAVGALLNAMTEGVMQAIASRSKIKSEFRLEQTMIAPVENNPFKFSATPREAILKLFDSGDNAYLSGPKAAQEAIDDINAHQMAVLAGTEAALRSILRRFNPDELEFKFDEESAVNRYAPFVKKAKSWDFYRMIYKEIAKSADDNFQQLFGQEFSTAYENQLKRLKIARKDSKT